MGGRKLGLVTITGVVGCEGGEQLGVTNSPLLGDKLMAWAGERGGRSGGGLVGVMPGISTGLDINWVGGWEKFSTHNSGRVAGWVRKVFHSDQQLPRNFPEDVGLLTGPLFF